MPGWPPEPAVIAGIAVAAVAFRLLAVDLA
jgi:hypothetical protein